MIFDMMMIIIKDITTQNHNPATSSYRGHKSLSKSLSMYNTIIFLYSSIVWIVTPLSAYILLYTGSLRVISLFFSLLISLSHRQPKTEWHNSSYQMVRIPVRVFNLKSAKPAAPEKKKTGKPAAHLKCETLQCEHFIPFNMLWRQKRIFY